MTRFLYPAVRGLVLLALPGAWCARAGWTQTPEPATLRGAVVAAETGERLAYAVIRLEPGFAQRFAADDGGFVVPGIAPGTYRLFVRMVGFRPFDSTLAVGPGTPPLRIELHRIVVQLGAIEVAADRRCAAPGPPDVAGCGDLATIFEQLKLNAQRSALLLDRYPFRYWVERELANRRRDGTFASAFDTLTFRSDARWPYRPGRVVADDPLERTPGSRVVHFPILADLADSLFQATHCFRLAGLDTLTGEPWVRLDFKASESLREPDVDGSVYLDPVTYQVRHTQIVVTNVTRAVRGVTGFNALASFRELRPNLLVVDRVTANTDLARTSGRSAVVSRFERQRLLRVDFVRGLPSSRDSVP